ncbi:MAG TPA: hypothetical protein VFP13_03865, partial [Actinomycetota bacterium]|nr:hypothetical protein [Actinomycetota bacterium]
MASTTSDLISFTGASAAGRAGGSFAFGKPARWPGSIARALASSLDVRRPERRVARPALPQALAKILLWIVA